MKRSISNALTQYQQKSIGHIGVLSYQYSNLCIKAEGSSLLGMEMDEDDVIYHIEDLAHVKVHDQEGDNDKIDLIPKNGDEDIEMLSRSVSDVHPEFIQSVEEVENGGGLHMLRLTMPEVNDDRKDVLEDAINACYDECKTKLDAVNTYYTGVIDAQLVGETKQVIDEVTGNMKTVKEKIQEIVDQFKADKLKELEDAYQRWLSKEADNSDLSEGIDGKQTGKILKMN